MLAPTLGLDNGSGVGGPSNEAWLVGFIAQYTSPFCSTRPYIINKNPVGKVGYTAGTGGKYRFTLRQDTADVPGIKIADRVIAEGHYVEDRQFPEWVNNGGFPLIVFPDMPLITKGQRYYFVMENIDPDPVHDYVSLDFLISKAGPNPDPNHFVMVKPAGQDWVKATTTINGITYDLMASPFGIFYANGCKQGNGGYQLAPDGSTMCGSAYGFDGLC